MFLTVAHQLHPGLMLNSDRDVECLCSAFCVRILRTLVLVLYLVPGTPYLTPGTQNLVPLAGTRTWYPVSGMTYLVPEQLTGKSEHYVRSALMLSHAPGILFRSSPGCTCVSSGGVKPIAVLIFCKV